MHQGARQMKVLELSRYALCVSIAGAMLAGCGSQAPIGAPNAAAQSSLQNRSFGRLSVSEPPQQLSERTGLTASYKFSAPLLAVANFVHSMVLIYNASAKNPSAKATITDGIDFPTGNCIDTNGTLYVANEPVSGPGWVSEYAPGKTQVSKTITKGIGSPAFCAIDSEGNLWVTNLSGPNVTEYKKGSTKPSTIITHGLTYPVGIAIDHSGNLYVSNGFGGSAQNVQVYSARSKSPTRTITDGVTSPVGITVDAKGALYVVNINQNNVEEYLAGKNHPYRTITEGMDGPAAATVNKKGWLYVSNYGNNVIVEFAPGSITLSKREISKGLYGPEGSAYFPPLVP
jgi:hypothetical protein